jgi:hypothetical protein
MCRRAAAEGAVPHLQRRAWVSRRQGRAARAAEPRRPQPPLRRQCARRSRPSRRSQRNAAPRSPCAARRDDRKRYCAHAPGVCSSAPSNTPSPSRARIPASRAAGDAAAELARLASGPRAPASAVQSDATVHYGVYRGGERPAARAGASRLAPSLATSQRRVAAQDDALQHNALSQRGALQRGTMRRNAPRCTAGQCSRCGAL